MKDSPIGVFDSGVGGLTCVKELLEVIPFEDIIYLGDTLRMPYGVNTKETIAKYANDDVDFLQRKGVKLVVAACGTVSSNVPAAQLHNLCVPFIDVIAPTISAAVKATKNKRIGIIGTPATIKSGSFATRLKLHDKDIQTVSNGCPQFVTLVEEGYIDDGNFITNSVAREYL
ncbi:MAG: glutamate racemase, partial [Oscillospiraceae bacterium]